MRVKFLLGPLSKFINIHLSLGLWGVFVGKVTMSFEMSPGERGGGEVQGGARSVEKVRCINRGNKQRNKL